jgi:hypothetical protein
VYVGRPIRFEIEGLDPAWGASVQIAIDYGDHSTPASLSAEDVRKQPFIHTYRVPPADRVKVAAAMAFRGSSLEPIDNLLGRGSLKFDVRVSPVSLAQSVADTFVNARFMLALLIASLVYYWQFQAKERSFGSRSLDYVKAFALGVAVEAAVANLPEAFGKLVLG